MEAFPETFAFIAGLPAIISLILTAAAIFLTSDWRLSLTALLVQYVLVGLTLTRFISAEVAIIKILVGVLAVAILYLSARRVQDASEVQEATPDGLQFLGLHLGWRTGPLGLPLRILALIMVSLAAIHFFDDYRSLLPVLDSDGSMVPADIAFVSLWLAATGMIGLVLSSEPLRVAVAVLTILTGFDLVYAGLEPRLSVVGFLAALILMAALAFAYLVTVQGLRARLAHEQSRAKVLPAAMPAVAGSNEEGGET
jgi:hypothetical protein